MVMARVDPNANLVEIDPASKMPASRQEALAVGAYRYSTGKPCKSGHVAQRSAKGGHCIECRRENRAAYCATERAKARIRSAANRAANPDKYREYQKAYYAANPEKHRKRVKAWQTVNQDKCAERDRNRRARKAMAEGRCTSKDADAIRAAQKDCCAYCRVKLRGAGHLDHIIALARGGSNWPRNMQWLCAPCNQSKHASDPIEFAQRKGLLI
jgi:5-methylcytosine-specific restriction endonuclease McrA